MSDQPAGFTRRTAMKAGALTLGAAAFAKALAPLTEWKKDQSVDDFLQKHYKELTPDELAAVLRRIEARTEAEHGVKVTVSDPRPTPGVQFGYALNLSICIGCQLGGEVGRGVEERHDAVGLEAELAGDGLAGFDGGGGGGR